jgi:16S rRNA (cytosine967-C5)-methyltransferase
MRQPTMQKMPSVSPARSAAFDILLRVERESSYASELLHSSAYESLSAPDHALATQLVMGVLRWRSSLDQQIAGASSQSLQKLDLEILIALRLGVYQFFWLDRIPQRAALFESVELVKRARKRSAAPFVNAVLRKIGKQSYDPTGASAHSAQELAVLNSHPLWLIERWVSEYGFETARRICDYDQTIPATAIRLRAPVPDHQLTQEGIHLSPGSLLSSARRLESGDISKLSPLLNAPVVIQDEASQLVAAIAARGCRDGECILDCCAAPGGKTLAMADQSPSTTITAVDTHVHRARLMRGLLSAKSAAASAPIQVVAADATRLPLSRDFDRVLADVPCSGTGTLARNPEIKWRLQPSDLTDLHQRQANILNSAMRQVAPGGRVIYSTCSLEREENEAVVEQVLRGNKSFRVLDAAAELAELKSDGKLIWPDPASLTRGAYLRTIPGVHPCDGFFTAILGRI